MRLYLQNVYRGLEPLKLPSPTFCVPNSSHKVLLCLQQLHVAARIVVSLQYLVSSVVHKSRFLSKTVAAYQPMKLLFFSEHQHFYRYRGHHNISDLSWNALLRRSLKLSGTKSRAHIERPKEPQKEKLKMLSHFLSGLLKIYLAEHRFFPQLFPRYCSMSVHHCAAFNATNV